MDYIKLAESFWENGFLVLENFYQDNVMDTLNARILQHFGMSPEWGHSEEFLNKSATEVVPWFPKRDGHNDFDEVENDERLKKLTTHILGEGWEDLYLMSMFSKQGTKGQAWHQDCPPENPSQFNLNRLFYTHDVNDETGGKTLVVPGSHRLGAIETGDPHGDINGQVIMAPKKGTLILIHGHLWHRVHPITGIYRVSTNSRVIPADTPEDITDIAVYRNIRYRFSTSEVIEERT